MDAIVLGIKLDSSGFYKSLDQIQFGVDKFAQKVKSTGKTMSAAFDGTAIGKFGKEAVKTGEAVATAGSALTGISASFLKLGGAVAFASAAMYKFLLETSKVGAEISIQSQVLNTTAEEYQKWDLVLQRNGLTTSELRVSLQQMTMKMLEARNGSKEAANVFKELGVATVDAAGNMRSNNDVLKETILSLSTMENRTQRNALASKLFGESSSKMTPLLNAGRQELELLGDAGDRYVSTSGKMAASSAQVKRNQTEVNALFLKLKQTALEPLVGTFAELTDTISDSAGWDIITGAAVVLGNVLSGVGIVATKLTQAFNVVTDAMLMTGEIFNLVVVGFLQATKYIVKGAEALGRAFGMPLAAATELYSFVDEYTKSSFEGIEKQANKTNESISRMFTDWTFDGKKAIEAGEQQADSLRKVTPVITDNAKARKTENEELEKTIDLLRRLEAIESQKAKTTADIFADLAAGSDKMNADVRRALGGRSGILSKKFESQVEVEKMSLRNLGDDISDAYADTLRDIEAQIKKFDDSIESARKSGDKKTADAIAANRQSLSLELEKIQESRAEFMRDMIDGADSGAGLIPLYTSARLAAIEREKAAALALLESEQFGFADFEFLDDAKISGQIEKFVANMDKNGEQRRPNALSMLFGTTEEQEEIVNGAFMAAQVGVDAMATLGESLFELSVSREQRELEKWKEAQNEKLSMMIVTGRRRQIEEKKIAKETEEREREIAKRKGRMQIAQTWAGAVSSIPSIWGGYAQAFAPFGFAAPALIAGFGAGTTALVLGAAAANTARISSEMQSFSSGGPVDGFNGAPVMNGDNRVVTAQSGEMFFNARQQRRLYDIANGTTGGGGNVNVNIYGNVRENELRELEDMLIELKANGRTI